MREVIERLQAASEGSLELSDAVMEAAHNIHDGPYAHWPSAARAFGWNCLVTTSLDAALALAERVLPGVWWLVGKGKVRSEEPDYGAQLLFGPDVIGEGEGPTPALALCIAILKARHGSEAS